MAAMSKAIAGIAISTQIFMLVKLVKYIMLIIHMRPARAFLSKHADFITPFCYFSFHDISLLFFWLYQTR